MKIVDEVLALKLKTAGARLQAPLVGFTFSHEGNLTK
jgi:hypothetical protein